MRVCIPLLGPQAHLGVCRVCREGEAVAVAALVVLGRSFRRKLLTEELELSLVTQTLLL